MAPFAVGLLLAALSAAPAEAAGNSVTLFAVSESGLMHLDSSGALLAWRPDEGQTGPVATNTRNGTVCWMRRFKDPTLEDSRRLSVRCAELSRLNQTWDLPLPLTFAVSRVRAFAFDEVAENWYFTVKEDVHLSQKNGEWHFGTHRNYICSYLFEKCFQFAEDLAPENVVHFFSGYDIPNGLMAYITSERGKYRMKLLKINGSKVHDFETYISDPRALAMDSAGRQIYWLDRTTRRGSSVDLKKISYPEQNVSQVTRMANYEDVKAIDAADGTVAIVRSNSSTISIVDGDNGQLIDLVSGIVRGGENIAALAKVEGLLTVKIVSPDTQLQTESACIDTDSDCHDFCITTRTNHTATATCLCPEGLKLLDLECRREHPSFVLLVGAHLLQAVNLRTEQASTILSNLTDGTRVDVYVVADAEFLLFWVDAGSLFRGRWSPGGPVKNVQLLVPATETVKVVEVAVYASQRHLFWIKRDDFDVRTGRNMVVQMSPLDGAYIKTVFVNNWEDHQDQVLIGDAAFLIIQNQFVRRRTYWITPLSYSIVKCRNASLHIEDPGGIVMEEPLSPNHLLERTFWVERSTQSIEYIFNWSPEITWRVTAGPLRLLSHPSLADAGGLDMTDSRLFWTERSTGQLWTVDVEAVSGVRALPAVTGCRSLGLIQPWRRPTIAPVCEEGRSGCSHFCQRAIAGFTDDPVKALCSCPDGMELGEDEKTCQMAEANTAGDAAGEYPGCVA